MKYNKENAFTANYKNPKIWDVKHGIGKSKYVSNAQIVSIIKKEKDASQLIHHAKDLTKMDNVQDVIKDTI